MRVDLSGQCQALPRQFLYRLVFANASSVYIKYQNRRNEYLAAWWNVVN